MVVFSNSMKSAWLGLLLACLAAAAASAQSIVAVDAIMDADSTDLIFTVDRAMAAGRTTDAIPYLDELIRRFEGSRGDRFERRLERFYFFMAAAWMELGEFENAVEVLRKYAAKFPNAEDAATVLEWLGDCHAAMDDHAAAAAAYKDTRNLHPVRGEALDSLLAKETDSLARIERWDDAVPLLHQLLRRAANPTIRGQAATLLVRAYLALDQVSEIIKILPQLLQVSESRYDVDFNVMLVQGGDSKYHTGDFASALLLYQLALTKEDILAWHDEQIAGLQQALRAQRSVQDLKQVTAMRTRLRNLEENRREIETRESFTAELLSRRGQAYFEMNQKWESFWTFWSIWKTLPNSDTTRQALYAAFALAGELNMDERALESGYSFVDSFGPGDFFDEVTLHLANLHLRRREYDKAIEMARKAKQMNPDHAFGDRLLFISGYSLFQMGDLAGALAAFRDVNEQFPGSESEEGSLYWIGMVHLFKEEYEDARDSFSEFCARYIGGIYYEDARFRLGVTAYGLNEFDLAREHFETFISDFPGSVLRGEAHSFMGDIAGAEGRMDDAIAQYQLVAKYTSNMSHVNYAAFQIGKILEMLERYVEMAEYFTAYLRTYRLEGQYTEAIYRLGFARKMLGDVDGMLKAYEDAIRRYGNRTDAFGIDLILRDWVAASKEIRQVCPSEALLRMRQEALDNGFPVLRWRIEWALSDLCDSLAPEAVGSMDLADASPAVLEWVGRIRASTRPDFARTAFEKVVEEYTESPWAEQALANWAELEAAGGDVQRALQLFERQFEAYPTSPLAAQAAKRIADMHFALRQFEPAMEAYMRVLEVKEWRGPLWPEALCQIGSILVEQGKLQEAFAYFQRVYVLYGGYPEWAARAYLLSGETLEKLNRRREAIDTYREMLANDAYRSTEYGRRAAERLGKLQ
jgi:tetratricopeptide (TPR) repeat protein